MAGVSIMLPFLPLVILFEIFSKLPAKSIIQLRCISKFFYSLTADPFLADMHRSLSLTLPSRLSILIAMKHQPHRPVGSHSFYTINFSEENQGTLQANRIGFLDDKTFRKGRFGSSSDGLICYSRNNGDITICNISTRQRISLPRIQPDCSSTCAMLGFDSFGKRYKVLMSAKYHADSDNNTKFNYKHWVFTLGVDKSWREINSPHFSKFYPFDNNFPYYSNYSVYIDGVIYSYNSLTKDINGVPNFEIGAFEVGDENLSMISFPDEFSERSSGQEYNYLDFFLRNSALLEVEGRLAMVLVRRISFTYVHKFYNMDVWIWEEAKEWKRLNIYIPPRAMEAMTHDGSFYVPPMSLWTEMDKDCLLRFTTNRAGEIVILCVNREYFSILVCNFKSEVWRIFDVGGVEDFPIHFPFKVSMYNIVDNVFSLE